MHSHQRLLALDIANPDKALPLLINELLPVGIKGLVLAGLLAALMSSLSSAFNSSSTLITIDFYKRAKPQASEKELVWIGQFATIILVLISLLYIPLIKIMTQSGGIIQYLQSVQAYNIVGTVPPSTLIVDPLVADANGLQR